MRTPINQSRGLGRAAALYKAPAYAMPPGGAVDPSDTRVATVSRELQGLPELSFAGAVGLFCGRSWYRSILALDAKKQPKGLFVFFFSNNA